MRPKDDLHESRLLATADDEDSSILPLNRFDYDKQQLRDNTETQKL